MSKNQFKSQLEQISFDYDEYENVSVIWQVQQIYAGNFRRIWPQQNQSGKSDRNTGPPIGSLGR